MKAKPRAPGPDGIHNNLLKHLPEDTLKILKDILNQIWISADFPEQWRAATVIPIPKPNKDHTDPLSYRPIALTSCLCKVLERMINARFIWYLEKHRILDRSQCGFRKHRSTTDHLVSLERYLRDAFAQRQQFAAHKCKVIHFTAPRSRAQRPPICKDWKHTSASGGVHKVPWAVVGLAPLI